MVTINNSIVAYNLNSADPNSGSDIVIDTGWISGHNNLIGNARENFDTSFVNGEGNLVGTYIAPIDPLFVQFEPYAAWSNTLWQTWDLHLTSDSPAIDTGSNALAKDAENSWILYDLDGYRRIANDVVDMGAYEYGSTPFMRPTSPDNFRNTDKTYNSITLDWNTAVRATGYDIRYRKSGDETWTTINNVTGTSKTFTDLDSGTIYQFQICASNHMGLSEWSKILSAMTRVPSIISSTESPQMGTQITTTLEPSDVTVTYQWYRGITSNSVDMTAISGAVSGSYTPTIDDVGYFLRVVATGTGDYIGSISHTLTYETITDIYYHEEDGKYYNAHDWNSIKRVINENGLEVSEITSNLLFLLPWRVKLPHKSNLSKFACRHFAL